jgi:hypothetical protein
MEIKSLASGFFKFFSISFLILFLAIELIQICYQCISINSIEPLITELGSKLFLTTKQLHNESIQIINSGGINVEKIDLTQNPLSGTINFLNKFGSFFTIFYMIYVWLFILTWLFGHSPFSTTDKFFKNLIFAIVIFIFLQSSFIMSNAAISHNVNCFSGCEGSVMNYISMPLIAFKDFFIAIGIIVNSILIPKTI